MNHTQHFHPANLQFLLSEARHEAEEFSRLPAPRQIRQPKFTSVESPLFRFLLENFQPAASLEVGLRLIGRRPGELLGFAEDGQGRQVVVIRRLSFSRRSSCWVEV